jgi:hypothetical protein
MRTSRLIFLAAGALVGALLLGGCSSDQHSLATSEGAPVELGDLSYNVVISRPLNPEDTEDKDYLQNAPTLPDNQFYMGVFLQIKNDGDSAQTIPSDFKIVDTEGNTYDAVPLHNDFSLDLGSRIQAGESLPIADSPAANGVIGGALVLFLMDESSTENRPLELQIPSASGETGTIELDL